MHFSEISKWPKDNGAQISEPEWDCAVSFLLQRMDMETWFQIGQMMMEKGRRWYVGEAQRIGRTVRGLLATGGFHWGAVCIQANWFKLVEDCVRRIYLAKVTMLE